MKILLRVAMAAILSVVVLLTGPISSVRAATPTLSSTSPATLATGVAIDANIILTFSEEVSAESGEITIYKWDDNTRFENIRVYERDKVLMGGKTVTINPTALFEYSTRYYVLIDGDAFDSVLDNQSFGGVESKVTINFTTASAPSTTTTTSPPSAIVVPKLGGKKCPVVGRTRTVGGVTFICKKTTKLVWRRA